MGQVISSSVALGVGLIGMAASLFLAASPARFYRSRLVDKRVRQVDDVLRSTGTLRVARVLGGVGCLISLLIVVRALQSFHLH